METTKLGFKWEVRERLSDSNLSEPIAHADNDEIERLREFVGAERFDRLVLTLPGNYGGQKTHEAIDEAIPDTIGDGGVRDDGPIT